MVLVGAPLQQKNRDTYCIKIKYRKEKNQDKNKEELDNNNTKQKTNELDQNDPNCYLLIVAWSFDQKKTNLNIVST